MFFGFGKTFAESEISFVYTFTVLSFSVQLTVSAHLQWSTEHGAVMN